MVPSMKFDVEHFLFFLISLMLFLKTLWGKIKYFERKNIFNIFWLVSGLAIDVKPNIKLKKAAK